MTRVLVIDAEPPQATRDGGAARMVGLLALLTDAGHEVTFAALRAWPPELVVTAERLASMGVTLAATDGELADYLAASAAGFDTVIVSRLAVATVVVPLVRAEAPRARLLYDAVHIEHLAQFRLAKLTGDRGVLAAALAARGAERAIVTDVDACLATTHEDAGELRGLDAGAEVHVVTAVHHGVDAAPAPTPAAGAQPRSGIVFLGYLGIPENALAVRRLIDAVWPRIQASAGPTPLTILGAGPPEWLLAEARVQPGLTVTGFRDDVDTPLREAALMVVPLVGGSGVKTKVLHAFARRLPVVGTADALRGLGAIDGVHALRAETDDELAAAALRILADPTLGSALAHAAADLLTEQFGPHVSAAAMQAAVGGVRA